MLYSFLRHSDSNDAIVHDTLRDKLDMSGYTCVCACRHISANVLRMSGYTCVYARRNTSANVLFCPGEFVNSHIHVSVSAHMNYVIVLHYAETSLNGKIVPFVKVKSFYM